MMTAPAPSLFRVFFRVASGTTGGRIVFAVCALMTAQGTGLRAAPGDIDTGFNPPFYINSPTSAPIIYGGVPLPDGSAVFCGSFIGLITGPAIATRLKTDGAVQTDFAAAAGNATLHVVAVQTDGKCLFSGLAPTAYFKRHLVDGSVDASFTAAPSADVRAITQQADGKLIIAGTFATVSGVARRGIARLNVADGSVDTSFDANVNGDVYSVALLPDGKMVIGGDFTQVGSVNRNQMARLNADGTLDSTFDAHLATSLSVQFVVVQADSKVIAGGPFTTTSALGRAGIARFNTDGSLDSLSITGPLVVSTVAVQADGKLILAGPFSTVNGTSNQGIVRLLADGTLDNSFKVTSFYGSSYVTLLANGKVMSTGGVVGQSVRGAARLLNDPASATFSIVSSSKVRWLRGGSAAEAQQVTFETSTDGGSTWNMLGTASRITGGWELSGPSLPAAGKLRARGRVAGGFDCGSSGIIEQVQSFSGTTLQGGDASLSGLSVSVGTLSGPFKPDVLNYSESVGTSSTSLTVTPTATDSRATVRVNGNNVASGSPSSPINLTPGNNTITIDVTAEDGTALAYSIKVYRSPTTLNAAFNSAIDVPATANGYIATGSAVNLSLNFAPPVGTELMVVKNTSLNWIQGTFSNLSQGQRVPLSFGGTTYYFVADYFGGSGNDLVLHWATVKPFAWGQYISNQPGKATGYEQLPVAVNQTGVLAGKTVAAISCGENHTLVLTSDGKVVAWGSNTSGQLGDGTTKNRTLPVLANTTGALSGKAVTAIAAGNEFSVAACSDGTVVAWGLNHHGQLGNGTTTKSALPVAVTSAGTPLAGRTVTSLAAGDDHCLALCADGTLLAWGGNFGALGNNTNTDKSTVPVQVTTISTPLEGKAVTSISAGQSYSLALCSDGTLAGWGHNLFGALGSGMGTDSQVPIPVTRTGTALEGKVVVSIAAGYDHSLAACADGSVVSWGSNALGIAGLNYSNVPVAVTTTGTALQGKQVTSVAAGVFDSLAICSDGTAVAWGMTGTLGNNSVWWQSETALAVDRTGVLAGKSVTLAGMGFFHAVVLCTDGKLVSWGSADEGQLGNDDPATTSVPIALSTPRSVFAGHTITALSTGLFRTLALCSDNTILTWFGSSTPDGIDQSGVLAGKTIASVHGDPDEGGRAICTDGTVATWSDTGWGSDAPKKLAQTGALTGKTIVNITSDYNHTLALCSDGTVAAWGDNSWGQLGDGSKTASTLPIAITTGVLAGKSVVSIATGDACSLALCSDGTVAAWGYGPYYMQGNGATDERLLPGAVQTTGTPLAGKFVTSIAAGNYHVLALCSDGTLVSWGTNDHGQLGNNSTKNSALPVAVDISGVLAGKTVTRISAGYSHSLAQCSDGTVVAWGENLDGQLGDNDNADSLVPVLVSSASLGAGDKFVSVQGGENARHSIGLVATAPGPQLTILDSAGNVRDDGNAYNLGKVTASSPTELSFTLRNNGLLSLSGITIAITGSNSGDVTKNLTGTATTLAPGASTKFSLSFKPAGLGPRNATVEVQSNDPDFNPYRIPLKATSVAGASVIDVQQPAGISLNAGTSTVNYGAVALTTIASKSFIINNRGVVPLAVTSTTITGVNAADFHLATLPPATISPVSSASFTVTFAPSAVGVSNASLHIASSDPNSPFDVLLTASGVTPPKITTQPVSVLAGLGQAVNLVAASEAGATLQWLKNNTVLTGETNGTLAIASLALTHGGAYNLRATKGGVFASSLTANLGVVSLTPQSVTVLEGRNLTLSLPASGPGLAYQWRKRGIKLFNGVNPLHSDSTIAGVATARLSISSAALADSDLYSCQVTMPDPQHPGKPFALESAAFTASVGIDDKRLVYPPSVWIVSGNVTDVVTSRNGANSFSITGQPQGVTIDSSGHFSGKPTISITTPTVHHLTITATGPNGPCTPLDVDVLVLPLNSKCMGSFNGLVDQDLASPSSDGGTLALTIIDTGFATGKITLGAASFNLTGRLDASATTNPQLNAALPRPAPQPPLQLATSIDRSDGHLTGTLTDSTTNTTYPVEAWLNPWNTTTNPSPYAATYTAALNIDTSLKANLSYPQGCGFATITAARDGTVSWSGKLADGSPLTASTFHNKDGEIPLHAMPYTISGSVHGRVSLSTDDDFEPANKGLRMADGSLYWRKANAGTSSTDRVYKSGFARHQLTVLGSEYIAPAASHAVLGIVDTGVGTNARITFSDGGLTGPPPIVGSVMASSLNRLFRITNANKADFGGAANPAALTMPVLTASTGAFSGSFTLRDPDPTDTVPPIASVPRTVSYLGLLVLRQPSPAGVGFFTLAKLPSVAEGTNPNTSPILSGSVRLEKK